MRDEEGPHRLMTGTRVLVAFMVFGSVGTLVLLVGGGASLLVSRVGGVDAALALADVVLAEHPVLVGGAILVVLVTVVLSLVTGVVMLRRLGRIFDRQVHVRVTDSGVSVQRPGSRYWRSSGVEVPFDAITAVEYNDPHGSSVRTEFGDARAPKFFAGRAQNWIRVERADDSAVYVGSDRPVELAETIARRAPGVEAAEPF